MYNLQQHWWAHISVSGFRGLRDYRIGMNGIMCVESADEENG